MPPPSGRLLPFQAPCCCVVQELALASLGVFLSAPQQDRPLEAEYRVTYPL